MNKQHIIDMLREEDPDTVVELLELSTEEILDAFYDKIEDRLDYLRKQYE